jgi:hypothetical protein
MLDKNSLPLGILLSLVLAGAGYGVLFGIYTILETQGLVNSGGFRPYFRERTCFIFAIAICAFLLNNFQKKHLYNSVRGVVIVIALMLIVWLVLFGKYIF